MKCSFISVVSCSQAVSTMVFLVLFEVSARGQATCVQLVCPTNITATMPCGADCLTINTYPPALATNTCNPTDLVVSYYPPPGSCFPLGTTPVIVTAVGGGVTNTCGFTVTVLPNDNCSSTLPVYLVAQSGATAPQAAALAASLGIPAGGYVYTNGQVDYIDTVNFLAAPVTPVTDPVIQSNLMAQTVNKVPGIPIKFEQLNFAALNALTVPGSNTAVLQFATGLTNSGLAPQSATPIVTHTVLTAIYTNGGTVMTASNSLDTEVSFQTTLLGFPVVGPGAQIQAAYGPGGQVTRLHYAARQLVAGPSVALIPPSVASNTAAAFYGGNAQISVQLVYYAPPLSVTTVSSLIPWYLCGGTMIVTNPTTGQISSIHLLRTLIPATADPNYVPAVQETAGLNSSGTQVIASASVEGGSPPYSYLWSGSPPNLWTNPGPAIQYTPIIQATPTSVSISPASPASATLSWPDPLGVYQMQANPNLFLPGWTFFTNEIDVCNELNMITINPTLEHQYFRLALSNQPPPFNETVGLKVVDNNGVYVGTRQNIGVNVIPALILSSGTTPVINWGTEGPYDQDLGNWDTDSWRSSMENYPSIFGPEQFDRGEYIAHPLDFIERPSGWDEQYLDTAAITFYCGHGSPNDISFTETYQGSGTPALFLHNNEQNLAGSWGNHQEQWMALLSCEVLAQIDDPKSDYLAFERWGPDFDGLHMMLGFETDAAAGGITGIGGDSFETVFIKGMAGKSGWTLTLQQAWFHAALTTGPLWQSGGVGDPAFLGPIGPGGVWDFDDFFWGMGTVGPTIRKQNIHGQQNILGWFYMYQTQ